MTLRTRLVIWVNGLLLVTIALVSGLTLFTTVQGLRENARRDALGTASLLASAASANVDAPYRAEKLIGDEMVVHARIAAHLIAVAEGRARMSKDEINAILKDITTHSKLDEFWITDSKGLAYLYASDKKLKEEVRFSPDPKRHPRSHVFWKLLADKTGTAAVVQKRGQRELDRGVFKYAAVSGVDKPRIVQVGYKGRSIEALTSQFDVQRLAKSVIDAGNLEEIFVTDPTGKLYSPGSDARVEDYYRSKLDIMAYKSRKKLEPVVRFRGTVVEASVPLAGFGGEPGALICRLSTKQLDDAVRAAIRDVLVLSVAGLIAGALLSSFLAKRISGPIRKLAHAAKVIGSGGFQHRVKATTDDEVGMLADSFNRMAGSLESYTRELARKEAEKEALRREMEIASEIQRSLLPASPPEVANFDIAAESVPAREVGGDFYDFIPLPEGRWGVVIADVSGKGVPAALLMGLSRSLIRAYSQERPSVLDAMKRANHFMVEDTRSGMFVTCFYAVIDPRDRSLTYVNAGHNPPVISREERDVLVLRASGTPLGILEDTGMVEQTCQLATDDVILMYTDGITEAQDPYGEQFGVDRLQEVAKNSNGFPAAEISGRVAAAVRAFVSGESQFDDMTTVVIKVL